MTDLRTAAQPLLKAIKETQGHEDAAERLARKYAGTWFSGPSKLYIFDDAGLASLIAEVADSAARELFGEAIFNAIRERTKEQLK